MTKLFNSYKLVDKKPVPCTPEESYQTDKRVAYDSFGQDISVSTVFLHIDHAWESDEEPILFETLVFGGQHDGYMQRYSTWEQAEEGHKQVCYMINKVAIERNNKLDKLVD
jgi:hypothetical protein